MSVLVIGGGAVGGLAAGLLAGVPGLDVTVATRSELPGLTLDTRDVGGALRTPDVRVVRDPDEVTATDWVIVATKAYDTPSARPWLRRAVGDDSTVVMMQNGIDHAQRVADCIAEERVVPAIVTHGVERSAPGVVRQTFVGEVTVPETPGGQAFRDLGQGSDLGVRTSRVFDTALWTKLAYNVVGSSLSALLDVPAREIGVRPALREVAEGLVAECAAAASTRGVDLPEGLCDEILAAFAAYSPAVHSSMWNDLRSGRPLEHRELSGAVMLVSDRHGLDAPRCRLVTQLLDALSTDPA